MKYVFKQVNKYSHIPILEIIKELIHRRKYALFVEVVVDAAVYTEVQHSIKMSPQ